ncbi:MAG: fatty acid desaturase [Spirochaetes bacterium]|nr:fatty acid desaturase [Spirochaetota bacterium]
MSENLQKPGLSWSTIAFLTGTPPLAALGIFYWFYAGMFNWPTLILFLLMWTAVGISTTAGYHRLFTHRAYEASWFVRLFFLCFGAASWEASCWRWTMDHHKHHRYVDTERDPYNIKQGFWHAHLGWLFREREYDHASALGVEYGKDALVRFQHKFYYPIAIGFAFALPAGIAALWGDAFGGFILAGLGVVVINHHFTFSINSFAHFLGRQPYSDKHTARDSHFLAFFNYGEGYHNYHHEFPNDYRNGIRWYHWDPTKWLIRVLHSLRLVKNLKQVSAELIVKRKIAMQQKRLQSAVVKKLPSFAEMAKQMSELAAEHTLTAARRWSELKKEYAALKRQKTAEVRQKLHELRARVKDARREFELLFERYRNLNRGFLKMAAA